MNVYIQTKLTDFHCGFICQLLSSTPTIAIYLVLSLVIKDFLPQNVEELVTAVKMCSLMCHCAFCDNTQLSRYYALLLLKSPFYDS